MYKQALHYSLWGSPCLLFASWPILLQNACPFSNWCSFTVLMTSDWCCFLFLSVISFWSLRALMEKMKKRRAAMEVNLILIFVFDGSCTIFFIPFNQDGSVIPCYQFARVGWVLYMYMYMYGTNILIKKKKKNWKKEHCRWIHVCTYISVH